MQKAEEDEDDSIRRSGWLEDADVRLAGGRSGSARGRLHGCPALCQRTRPSYTENGPREKRGRCVHRPLAFTKCRLLASGVLEDVEAVVHVACGDVLLAVSLEHLHAPEVVAALVDEVPDLGQLATLDLHYPEAASVVGEVDEIPTHVRRGGFVHRQVTGAGCMRRVVSLGDGVG